MTPDKDAEPTAGNSATPRQPKDGGPWQGPSTEEWIHRIADPATPPGETIPWIKPLDETHIVNE
jgi:hypothetical protein